MDETPRPPERTGTTDLPPDERELLATWDAFHARAMFDRAIAKADTPRAAEVLKYGRDREPDVSALDALSANRRLVDLLVGRRWYVMQAAREAGVTWADIAEAVGYEGELAAMEEYREAIDRQAKYVGDLHDAARAEAALEQTGPRRRPDGPRAAAAVEVLADASATFDSLYGKPHKHAEGVDPALCILCPSQADEEGQA